MSKKVCREVNIPVEYCVSGPDLELMTPEEFSETVERSTVLAKLTPLQKMQVVEVLKQNGHVTGFLGDGINDVLALKAADVGISVDSASDVAKEGDLHVSYIQLQTLFCLRSPC